MEYLYFLFETFTIIIAILVCFGGILALIGISKSKGPKDGSLVISSLKEDLDNQRPLELNEILGEAVRIGKKNQVEMSTCELVFNKLQPYIYGGKKYI